MKKECTFHLKHVSTILTPITQNTKFLTLQDLTLWLVKAINTYIQHTHTHTHTHIDKEISLLYWKGWPSWICRAITTFGWRRLVNGHSDNVNCVIIMHVVVSPKCVLIFDLIQHISNTLIALESHHFINQAKFMCIKIFLDRVPYLLN